jgi:hypothetical protein
MYSVTDLLYNHPYMIPDPCLAKDLQEAVGDRIQSNSPACPTDPVKSRARILRGIRLASLMSGTPEAIPVCNGKPLFLRSITSHDPCQKGLMWQCFTGH